MLDLRPNAARFNGAATEKSRKDDPDALRAGCYDGFNGAATEKSRKVTIGELLVHYDKMLQWGRD